MPLPSIKSISSLWNNSSVSSDHLCSIACVRQGINTLKVVFSKVLRRLSPRKMLYLVIISTILLYLQFGLIAGRHKVRQTINQLPNSLSVSLPTTVFSYAQKHWGISSPEQRHYVNELLLQFDVMTRNLKVTYVMHQETALGAYRHHGLIPWDHRLIVLLSSSSLNRLRDNIDGSILIMEYRQPERRSEAVWTVYLNEYSGEKHEKDKDSRFMPWPYIELHTYKLLQDDDLIDSDDDGFHLPFHYIFPPTFVQFENLLLPTYHCLEKVLSVNYHLDSCCLAKDHVTELKAKSPIKIRSYLLQNNSAICTSCKYLRKSFKFVVERIRLTPFTILEESRIGEKVVNSKTFYRPTCR